MKKLSIANWSNEKSNLPTEDSKFAENLLASEIIILIRSVQDQVQVQVHSKLAQSFAKQADLSKVLQNIYVLTRSLQLPFKLSDTIGFNLREEACGKTASSPKCHCENIPKYCENIVN